jgi:phosphopantothenate--cysteine ligase
VVRNILITAGGTSEKIDEVRVISNFATGKLGLAVAKAFLENESMEIGKIYYLCDKSTHAPSHEKVEVVRVSGTQGLLDALKQILTENKIDAVIHSMAVSDYSVRGVTTLEEIQNNGGEVHPGFIEGKISSDIDDLVILLKRTPKVIGEIKKLQEGSLLVGFKLLTNVEKKVLIDTACRLLEKNRCDFVLANDLTQIEGDKHIGYLISADGEYETFSTKQQIAEGIVNSIDEKLRERSHGL